MSDNLKDILGNSNKDIDNQKLMDYLSKKLSNAEEHDLEKMMADDEFMNDAVEGLQQFKNKSSIDTYTEQLNRSLQKQLAQKQQRREKRKLKEQPWILLAIITLLLLCIIAYMVMKKRMDNKSTPQNKTTSISKQPERNLL